MWAQLPAHLLPRYTREQIGDRNLSKITQCQILTPKYSGNSVPCLCASTPRTSVLGWITSNLTVASERIMILRVWPQKLDLGSLLRNNIVWKIKRCYLAENVARAFLDRIIYQKEILSRPAASLIPHHTFSSLMRTMQEFRSQLSYFFFFWRWGELM